MIKIKKGDLLKIRDCEGLQRYYYTGIIDRMTYNGVPCVFLATDLKNQNTYARFHNKKLLNMDIAYKIIYGGISALFAVSGALASACVGSIPAAVIYHNNATQTAIY